MACPLFLITFITIFIAVTLHDRHPPLANIESSIAVIVIAVMTITVTIMAYTVIQSPSHDADLIHMVLSPCYGHLWA